MRTGRASRAASGWFSPLAAALGLESPMVDTRAFPPLRARWTRRLCAHARVAMLVVFPGCATPTSPDETIPTTFTYAETFRPLPLVVSDSAGVLWLRGVLSTSSPCWTLSPSASRRADSLRVDLFITEKPVNCQNYIAAFTYTIGLLNLPIGPYKLRLRYLYRGRPTYDQQVLDTIVARASP